MIKISFKTLFFNLNGCADENTYNSSEIEEEKGPLGDYCVEDSDCQSGYCDITTRPEGETEERIMGFCSMEENRKKTSSD